LAKKWFKQFNQDTLRIDALEKGTPEYTYQNQRRRFQSSLFITGLVGTASGLILGGVQEHFPAEVHPLFPPSALVVDSLGVVAVSLAYTAVSLHGKLKKMDKLTSAGVDIGTLNKSRKERVKNRARGWLGVGVGFGSFAMAGTIDSGIPPQPKAPLVAVVPEVFAKNSYFDTNGTTSQQIYCGAETAPNGKSLVVDKSKTVLPSSPEVFRLAKEGASAAVNNVFVYNMVYQDDSLTQVSRYDFFQIAISDNNVDISKVSDTKVTDETNASTPNTPYRGKNSPTGEWSFKHRLEYAEGSFGITDWEVIRQDSNYYLGLACDTSSLTH
jgi:hypothetical protein